MGRPIDRTIVLPAVSANAIALSQTTGGAGNLTLNGALAGTTLVPASKVAITSVGNVATVVFTITGTTNEGLVVTDTITGVNTNTVTGSVYFRTITNIAANAAVGSNVTVGNSNQTAAVYSALNYKDPFEYTVELIITGTASVTIQEAYDDISVDPPIWYDVSGLDLITASDRGKGNTGTTAMRITTNSYTGTPTIRYRVVQLNNTRNSV